MDLVLTRSNNEDIDRQTQTFFGTPHLQDFLDRVAEMVIVINQLQDIIFANHAAREFFKSDPDKTVGLRFGEAFGCANAFRKGSQGCGTTDYCKVCGAQEAIQNGVRGLSSVKECRILREDSSALDLKVYSAMLSLKDDDFVVLSVTDISNEKRRRALERIFFHDFANTIGSLYGFSQLLNDETMGSDPELKKEVLLISERLVEELNAQRDLAAAESNELKIHPEEIDSGDFLKEMAGRYRKNDVAEGKEIVVDEKSDNVPFRNDRILLSRVVGNMIKNALEASKEGDTVRVRCVADEQEIKFQVANPAFIPKEARLQIFQRSFSTKGTGRGLGTYSMKMISEQYLQGTVYFTSTAGGGTVFTARYPRRLD